MYCRVSVIIFRWFQFVWSPNREITTIDLNYNKRIGEQKKKNENLSSADNDPKLQNMSFHVVERTERAAKCKGMKLRVFSNFEIYKLLSPLSSWPPKLLIVVETPKATGSELFSLLPSLHITTFTSLSTFSPLGMISINLGDTTVVAREMFSSVCRPRLKNARAYNSIAFCKNLSNGWWFVRWIAPSNLWTTRGWWESPLLWVATNLSLVVFAQALISGCLLSCLNWWQYFLVFGSEKNHVDKLFMKNIYHKWTLQASIQI